VNKGLNHLNGVYSGVTRHNINKGQVKLSQPVKRRFSRSKSARLLSKRSL
jgi:hypothetical protein